MNRADKIIATAAKEALRRNPDVAGASPHDDALTRACRAAFQLGWLEGDVRKLCAILDAMENPAAKTLGFDAQCSSFVCDEEVTAYYDVVRDEPDVGIVGGACLTAVYLRGVDILGALDEKVISRIEQDCNDAAYQAAANLRADIAEHRRQVAKDDALEARLED